jgi:hypothetical protein
MNIAEFLIALKDAGVRPMFQTIEEYEEWCSLIFE